MDDRNDLIALAERIEADAWEDIYAAVPPSFAASTGLRTERVGGGCLALLPALPHPLFNRWIGFGLEAPVSDTDLDHVQAVYTQAGVAGYALSPSPLAQTDDLDRRLQERGLSIPYRWTIMARDTATPAPSPTADLAIRAIDQEEADLFAQTLPRAYETPDFLLPLAAATVGHDRWHHYLAYDGVTPVACAALYVTETAAWCGLAATLPSHRSRGAQSGLFARRIADAAALGCRYVITGTVEQTPDWPNASYRNMVRAGFRQLYLRPNWSPSVTA